jgi:alkanesulfonate monooxygenase SsuD/methylene tetrahydromethanopterin reductase-like flavin-dependent oxidoreductase (luciferase family)
VTGAGEAVAVKFWTSLPGLSRWPPAGFAVPGENWQEHLAAADFQRIAAAADRLGFDAVSVPEHVVLPRELAGHMGGRCRHRHGARGVQRARGGLPAARSDHR